MQPLSRQVTDPWLLAGLLLYVPLVLWPVLALARAERRRVAWTCAALAVGLGLSAWRFTDTPAGVFDDVQVNMAMFGRQSTWTHLWLERLTINVQGWNFLPIYLLNRGTGTLLGERVVGFAWHALLIIAAGVLLPRRGLPIGLAMIATSPTVLWLSRNSAGTDVLLQQLYVIAALDVLRTRRHAAALLVAGLGTGLFTYAYVPARIVWLYPALWLWRVPLRALAVYLLVALCFLTSVVAARATRQQPTFILWPSQIVHYKYRTPTPSYAFESVRALWNPAAGGWGTWSYPGAQTIPWSSFGAAAAGTVTGGRYEYPVAAALGLLPDVASSHNPARSHRQMMFFIPLALAAGGAAAVLPPWLTNVLAAGIAAEGAYRWTSDEFWAPAREAAFLQTGLFPCDSEERMRQWCPRWEASDAPAPVPAAPGQEQ